MKYSVARKSGCWSTFGGIQARVATLIRARRPGEEPSRHRRRIRVVGGGVGRAQEDGGHHRQPSRVVAQSFLPRLRGLHGNTLSFALL
jgi:hypothetical protein